MGGVYNQRTNTNTHSCDKKCDSSADAMKSMTWTL